MDVFSMMPIEVFMDERLAKNDIRVLGAILSFRNKDTNLCWPKRDQISKRCNLPLTRISSVTTRLVKLGWLKKTGDGGRSRSSSYELVIPELTDKTAPNSGAIKQVKTVTKPVTLCNEETITEPVTVTEPVTKTVTEPVTKTVTEPVTRIKQTNEQTNEQTNKRLRKKLKNEFILPDWVDKKIWGQWMQVRKAKKLVNTDIALNALIKNILKSSDFGITPNEAMIIAVEKSWGGFDPQWIVNMRETKEQISRPVKDGKRQAVRIKSNNLQNQDFIDVQFQRVAT